MKNSELIAMLSALPLDLDVLVHGDVDDDDHMFQVQEAHVESTCNEGEEVIRLNLGEAIF